MNVEVNKEENDFKRHINLTIEKAYRLLKTAKVDFENGGYESSTSRSYYAVFHIMEGALLIKGFSFSKHSAVIANFNTHFIKTGILNINFLFLKKRFIHSLRDKKGINLKP